MKCSYQTVAAVLALVAVPSLAQSTHSLPEVTVPGSRLFDPKTDADATRPTLGATTCEGDALQSRRATTSDTAGLLKDFVGLSLGGAGGVSSLPALHGLGDDRLRIEVDEMDILPACGNHMNPVLSYIDPSQVGRIRVYTGVTPVSVGGDSIGGTIQVESLPPEFVAAGETPKVSGSVGGSLRSNADGRAGNASVTWAGERLNLSYQGAVARASNYRAARDFKPAESGHETGPVIAGNEVGSTAFRTQNHKLGAAWRFDEHLLQADVGWQDIGFQGFPNQRMDMTANRSTQVNLRYTGRYQWGDLKVHGWRQRVRHQMDMGPDRYSYGTGMPMRTSASTTGGSVQANWLVGDADTVRAGAEFQRYTLYDWWPPVGASGSMAPNNFWNIDYGKRNKAGAFVEWEKRLAPGWTTLVGARFTRVTTNTGPVQGYNSLPTYADDAASFNALDRRRSNNNLDLTALATYEPDAGQHYEFGIARKVRTPSLYQRYPWSTNTMAAGMNNTLGDGNGYLGNPNLKPETAYTVSATGDWHAAGESPEWGVRATAHFSHIENYIDAVRCSSTRCKSGDMSALDQFVILQYANHDARIFGFDVSGHRVFANSTEAGRFTLMGSASWLRGKNQTTGDNLYNIMPLSLKFGLEHRIAAGGGFLTTALDWEGAASKRRASAVRNELKTAGYGLLHLRGSYEIRQVRVDFGIANLLNKAYALPLGGVYVGQGSTMMLNTAPWGVAVPGPGRSFYVAFNVKF